MSDIAPTTGTALCDHCGDTPLYKIRQGMRTYAWSCPTCVAWFEAKLTEPRHEPIEWH